VSVAGQWTSTSCVALAARVVRWRIEQAEEFPGRGRALHRRRASDLGGRHGPLPHPSSPLVIHRFRDPRPGDAYALVLPTVVVGCQVLGDVIVVQAADIIQRP
jgi:hypothetical protein